MSRALIAPLMTEDHKPTVGEYALDKGGTPVLMCSVTDSGQFEIGYVSGEGRSGGASMWWGADRFTVLKSSLEILRCNIHHAARMADQAKIETKNYQEAQAVYTAALEVMRSLEERLARGKLDSGDGVG